ncbi:MAG: transcriptional repressor [Proteobacteria bacterium]|nr:transcriptional repressor [Pseudomonadota bacterium]MBS0598862.1 transcriptional repressor [Pseudomonadota bacterium]
MTCTDPSHHVKGGDDYIDAVHRIAMQRGVRLTTLRENVLRLVAGSAHPVKAYDLLQGIGKSGTAAAPVLAYRALDFLLEQRFVHKLETVNAYVACHHPGTGHCVPFLICDGCQVALELEDGETAAVLEREAGDLGFTVRSQTLEVHGLCKHCQR